MDQKLHTIALALGSNLGDRLANLRAAIGALPPDVTVIEKSAVYETPPAYVTEQPAFLNAALIATTQLTPDDLLRFLKQREVELGREVSIRNGPRLIDIDIIFYDDLCMSDEQLILPHPRLAEREFVLRPLADIAAGWRYPHTDLTVQDMLQASPHATARRIKGVI